MKRESNRRASSTKAVRSSNSKANKSDGRVDLVGSLRPNLGKRVGKDHAPSVNTTKRVRPDEFMDDFGSNRKPGGYVGSRAAVHRTPGVEAERVGHLIETFDQGEPPSDLDIPD